MSAEGGYRGPQGAGHSTGWGDYDTGPLPAIDERTPIDVTDAEDMQRAWVRFAVDVPSYARVIDVLVFHDWYEPKWQARKLGMRIVEMPAALDKAKAAFRNSMKLR